MRFSGRFIGAMALLALVVFGGLLVFVSPSEIPWFPHCAFRQVTGLPCPGCGGSRAIHAAMNGDFASSISLNILALPLGLLAAYALARVAAESLLPWRWPQLPRTKAFWFGLTLVVVVFGVVRNLPGFPFPLPN